MILKTEVVDMFAACSISSRDMRRSSSNRVLTITTDASSVAVTGRYFLGCLGCLPDLHGNKMPTVTPCYDPLHCPHKPHEFWLGFFLAKFQFQCMMAGHCVRSDSSQLLPFQGSRFAERTM